MNALLGLIVAFVVLYTIGNICLGVEILTTLKELKKNAVQDNNQDV